jgi:predicted TPR repeat methyltransferase
MSRPELTGHASLFYNAKEAKKYDSSSRMVSVQREITERAMELLRLPEGSMQYILDVGCGSGLSGQVLEESGHVWVGCDVSRDMLAVAKERMEETLLPSKSSAGDAMNNDSDDDDDDESEEEETPSTGDVMHHVSSWVAFAFALH